MIHMAEQHHSFPCQQPALHRAVDTAVVDTAGFSDAMPQKNRNNCWKLRCGCLLPTLAELM